MVTFVFHKDNRWKDWEFLPEHTPGQADAEYAKHTAEIVRLTGHEYINNPDGSLIPREKREQNYTNALKYLNDNLKLGLDDHDLQILSLVYTALSEVPRFGGDDHMIRVNGENTGTHSLHTPIRANKIISKALDRMGKGDDRDSVIARQLTALCLLPHDIGETLGEPGSLAQEVSNAHNGFKKDKPGAEWVVLNGMLRWAAYAVEKGDKSIFYDVLEKKRVPDMSGKAIAQNNEEFLKMMAETVGVTPELKSESEGRIKILGDFWKLQEHRVTPDLLLGNSQINVKFYSYFASLCEHVQGTGHFNKFCTTDKRPDSTGSTVSTSLAQSARMMANFKYCEGEVADLFANAHTDLEKAIAVEAKKEVYTKLIDLLKNGPTVIDRKANNVEELRPKDEGRKKEIQTKLQLAKGQEAQSGRFGAIPPVVTRERLIALYEWGREHDEFIPEPGQLLAVTPPAEFVAPQSKRVI